MLKCNELSDPNSCLNKADDGEMLFVLLERDFAAPETIREWVRKRVELGLNQLGDTKLVSALATADYIERKNAKAH